VVEAGIDARWITVGNRDYHHLSRFEIAGRIELVLGQYQSAMRTLVTEEHISKPGPCDDALRFLPGLSTSRTRPASILLDCPRDENPPNPKECPEAKCRAVLGVDKVVVERKADWKNQVRERN
jgi:hypothetical protein